MPNIVLTSHGLPPPALTQPTPQGADRARFKLDGLFHLDAAQSNSSKPPLSQSGSKPHLIEALSRTGSANKLLVNEDDILRPTTANTPSKSFY